MIDERKAGINAALLFVCTVLLICGALWNYILYKMEQSDYRIVSGKIIGVERMTKASKWAIFECEVDGDVIEGKVILNIWEKEGDIIEVAYHKYARTFVRPYLCLDGFSAFILFWCVGLSVYFILLVYKKYVE